MRFHALPAATAATAAAAATAASAFLLPAATAFAPSPTIGADRRIVALAPSALAAGAAPSRDDDGGGGSSATATAERTRGDFLRGAAASLLTAAGVVAGGAGAGPLPALATDRQETMDVNEFLRTGIDTGGPMGVSSQAGKSRPETGVYLRDGSDVSRDARTGDVLAEIVLGSRTDPVAVLVGFSSPWPLATGPVYDVECRDGKTGDGAFLSVTTPAGGKSVTDLPPSFFLDQLFAPTGRFSFYGPPTDIKAKKSEALKAAAGGGAPETRLIEVSFSSLSQSTQTEIPRTALVAATIPEGTDQAVMLVTSATGSRWRKAGVGGTAREVASSFRAVPAPKTSLKVRRKERGAFLSL